MLKVKRPSGQKAIKNPTKALAIGECVSLAGITSFLSGKEASTNSRGTRSTTKRRSLAMILKDS